MRRLYLQIYVAFLGILLLFGGLVSLTWFLAAPSAQGQRLLDGMGAIIGELFPAPDRPVEELQARVERLASLFPAHLTVRAANGAVLATVGEPLPAPPLHWSTSGWLRSRGAGPTVALLLPDGRWVVARLQRPTPTMGWLVALGLLVVAIALAPIPLPAA